MKIVPFDIKIGCYTWVITVVNESNPELEGDDGCCDFSNKIIYLSSRLNKEQMWYTLLHEITHALLEESTFESDISRLLGDNYERFVELFSRNLNCIFDLDSIKKYIFSDYLFS